MLPCADCVYKSRCLKWASRFCLDYKPTSLPPPLTALATRQTPENRSTSDSPNIFPITPLHISRRPVRLRA